MRRSFFDYVGQIRNGEKYFDVSSDHIERELRVSGKCEIKSVFDFVDDNGEEVSAELRLNFSGQPEYRRTWKVALKLHDTRIDGVDFETKYDKQDGHQERGWHRHHWNSTEESAERHKLPVDGFDEVMTHSDFIHRAMSTMRFVLNKLDHGETGSLFFN